MVSHPTPQGAGPTARRCLPVFLLLLCALCGLTVSVGVAHADEGVSTGNYKAQETVTITVNALGDAHYVDVVKYESAFFNTAGFSFDKYPFLLSRRFEQKAAVSEIENFKSRLDRDAATVTLTFDKPGYAYNLGDHWMLPGFDSEPTLKTGRAQIFQQNSTENNEFTLWQDLDFTTTTHLKLPAAAKNIHWDEDDNAMLYELAYIPPMPPENVLQRNRGLFAGLFGALIAISLGVATVVLLRKRPVAVPAAQGIPAAAQRETLMPGAPPVLTVTAEPAAAEAATTLQQAAGETVSSAGLAEAAVETSAPAQSDIGDATKAPVDQGHVVAETVAPVVGGVAISETGIPEDEGEVVEEAPPTVTHRPRFCEHCGESLSGEAQFCPECGRHVGGSA